MKFKPPKNRWCTVKLAQAYDKSYTGYRSGLDFLARKLLGEEQPTPHNADSDVNLTAKLFLKIKKE